VDDIDFEWDRSKAEANLRKHEVSFEEARSVILDPLALTGYDPDHSETEDRYLTIGTSDRGRILYVSHTDRDGVCRIISARKAAPNERKDYEDGDVP
jgi:uncharacterized DUF497 family protein